MTNAEYAHEAFELAGREGCSFDAAMRVVTASSPAARQAAEQAAGIGVGDDRQDDGPFEMGADWRADWARRVREFLDDSES